MKPTIYDIARLAGVSTATVSKVFNNRGSISDKTKKRIMAISEELNYQPSGVASALAGKKTFTIGLLIPDVMNPFFAEMTRHVEDRAHELGFNLVICNTDNNQQKELKYIQLLRQKRVDGIVAATGVSDEKLLKELIKDEIPVALISRDMSVLSASTVLVDDFAGGHAAASYLIALGHRRIGIVTESLDIISSRDRVRGFQDAMDNAGLTLAGDQVKVSDFSPEGGSRAACELLDSTHPPTAIFACNDILAIGVMHAARQKGLSVPLQLSVIGFDNTLLAALSDPPLTTIAQPIQAMGQQVVDLITREINEITSIKQRIVLLPELVIRGSAQEPAT
ncbi:LacI family DNA-binding transcriptional regulator [Paenibacillus lemnae]|uniref:LacI family transcriptional regulator n=1 Tax=Paenibacillus lemnae TaxID=1330551 RepID=A0A848M382_PAELE|nr:LacI family DNA-binding transcriptional regulator [Paenibacillus lemnae]NMO94719.1 LacI family transcriptional regulator [Paenibacillus lemnae]